MADSVAAVSMGALVSGNRIVYAKRLRDKGERATTRYHSQEFPRSASDGEMTAPPYGKQHWRRREIFGSARRITVTFSGLTQACLLYNNFK